MAGADRQDPGRDLRARHRRPAVLTAGTPLEIPITGLSPNTRYYYRLFFQPAGGSKAGATDESSFHTARTAGSAFTFTIQADPINAQASKDTDCGTLTVNQSGTKAQSGSGTNCW